MTEVKKTYQIDVTASIRCAVLAETEDEARKLAEQEMRRLLSQTPAATFYIDINSVYAKIT